LNSRPRCTLIQRFDGEVIVVGPRAASRETFMSLADAEKAIDERGWAIGFIHPSLKSEEA